MQAKRRTPFGLHTVVYRLPEHGRKVRQIFSEGAAYPNRVG